MTTLYFRTIADAHKYCAKLRNYNYENRPTYNEIVDIVYRLDVDIPLALELLNANPIHYGYSLTQDGWIKMDKN